MHVKEILDLAIEMQTAETDTQFDAALLRVDALSETDRVIYNKFEAKIAVARTLHMKDDAVFKEWVALFRRNTLTEYNGRILN